MTALWQDTPPDVFDHAAVEAARLTNEARSRLLSQGVVTIDMLAEGRGTTEGAARQWVKRARAAGRLVVVTRDGRTLLPTFQFDAAFEPRAGVADVVTALTDAGLDGWATWHWLTASNGWVGGAIPLDLIDAGDDAALGRALHGLTAQDEPRPAA